MILVSGSRIVTLTIVLKFKLGELQAQKHPRAGKTVEKVSTSSR